MLSFENFYHVIEFYRMHKIEKIFFILKYFLKVTFLQPIFGTLLILSLVIFFTKPLTNLTL